MKMKKEMFMVEDDIIANNDVRKSTQRRTLEKVMDKFALERQVKLANMGELKSLNIWFLDSEIEEILNEVKDDLGV